MKKSTIISIVAILVIASPFLLAYLTIKNSTDCSQLVIDTYEMHSGINIPKVDFVNCYFDEGINTRISIYDLKDSVDLSRFKVVNTSIMSKLKGYSLLSELEKPPELALYLASGSRWGRQWTYIVDLQSQRLWAELNF